MITLGILDMLRLYGFDAEQSKCKLVRHKDSRYPIDEMLRGGWLDLYQSYQSKPKYHGADTIVSFYGLAGNRSCLYGVFKINNLLPAIKGPNPEGCPWIKIWRKECIHYYELERVKGFEALERRLIVNWSNPRAWCQNPSNIPVVELLAEGRQLPVFEDYMEFTLSHQQLKQLYQHPEAHRDWCSALQAVAGVYLILAEKSGHLYVGSAYGANGIWGRWAQYAKNGHGGNKLLIDLLAKDPSYPEKFTFSLLQILPKTLTHEEVISREGLYKQKLGSRATGLNVN